MEIDRYLVKAGNFWTTSTPNILRVREFTVTNQYARISNTINLQISLTTDLPSN